MQKSKNTAGDILVHLFMTFAAGFASAAGASFYNDFVYPRICKAHSGGEKRKMGFGN